VTQTKWPPTNPGRFTSLAGWPKTRLVALCKSDRETHPSILAVGIDIEFLEEFEGLDYALDDPSALFRLRKFMVPPQTPRRDRPNAGALAAFRSRTVLDYRYQLRLLYGRLRDLGSPR
jgi:hypothetical protein